MSDSAWRSEVAIEPGVARRLDVTAALIGAGLVVASAVITVLFRAMQLAGHWSTLFEVSYLWQLFETFWPQIVFALGALLSATLVAPLGLGMPQAHPSRLIVRLLLAGLVGFGAVVIISFVVFATMAGGAYALSGGPSSALDGFRYFLPTVWYGLGSSITLLFPFSCGVLVRWYFWSKRNG